MQTSTSSPRGEFGSSNVALLQQLSIVVSGEGALATFACGGSVTIADPAASTLEALATESKASCPPITLRFDVGDGPGQSRVSFPMPQDEELSHSMLETLLNACQPATFGLGGRDILDENYRKAAKLDSTAFSTNFHPQDCGVIESIQQILLPSTIAGGQRIGFGPQGIRTELYKLNVRSSRS